MTYAISMGVSRAEPQLRVQIDAILDLEHLAIERILDAYHVPRLPMAPDATAQILGVGRR